MALIQTVKGLVPREQLVVAQVITETDNSMEIATEWRLRQPDTPVGGELVRRDLHIMVLRPNDAALEQANLG